MNLWLGFKFWHIYIPIYLHALSLASWPRERSANFSGCYMPLPLPRPLSLASSYMLPGEYLFFLCRRRKSAAVLPLTFILSFLPFFHHSFFPHASITFFFILTVTYYRRTIPSRLHIYFEEIARPQHSSFFHSHSVIFTFQCHITASKPQLHCKAKRKVTPTFCLHRVFPIPTKMWNKTIFETLLHNEKHKWCGILK